MICINVTISLMDVTEKWFSLIQLTSLQPGPETKHYRSMITLDSVSLASLLLCKLIFGSLSNNSGKCHVLKCYGQFPKTNTALPIKNSYRFIC